MKILFSGDFMPINEAEKVILSNDQLLDSSLYSVFESVDLRVINLECPLTRLETPSVKTGKNFKSDPDVSSFLKKSKIDVACLANNHIMDFGPEGLKETVEKCEEQGTEVIGVYDQGSLRVYRNKQLSLSIINVAEIEFGQGSPTTDGYFGLDTAVLYNCIQKERTKSKKVVLVIHGGREFHDLPSPKRVRDYRMFVDFGVDAIVSHHTHTLCGYEFYKNKPIVYGLGNFVFPDTKEYRSFWNLGMLVIIDFSKDSEALLEFLPIEQKYRPYNIRLITGGKKKEILNSWFEKTTIIKNSLKLEEAWINYVQSQSLQYFRHLNLIGKWKYKLYLKGLLKSPPEPKITRLLVQLSMLRCDAHREQSIDVLQEYLKNER